METPLLVEEYLKKIMVEVSMPQFTSCDTCISYMYRQAKVVYVLYVITRTAKLQYD